MEYTKSNAKFKRSIRDVKNNSIQQFTSDINPYSNPNKTWANIKRLFGGIPPKKHPLP